MDRGSEFTRLIHEAKAAGVNILVVNSDSLRIRSSCRKENLKACREGSGRLNLASRIISSLIENKMYWIESLDLSEEGEYIGKIGVINWGNPSTLTIHDFDDSQQSRERKETLLRRRLAIAEQMAVYQQQVADRIRFELLPLRSKSAYSGL